MSAPRSHGDGTFTRRDFRACGDGCVFEPGVLVFHADTIEIGDNVYVGHNAILKGYYNGEMTIGDGTWIGQQVFMHAAGGIHVGKEVGIGPGVKIITSTHREPGRNLAIMHGELEFVPVIIEDGADIGVGAVILPGVRIGKGAQVGAGAVVTRDVQPQAVVVGNPAKLLRMR